MIEVFQQAFMLRALAAAAIAGLALPLLGNFIVPKKLSLLGDSSSHFTFAALALGALLGFFNIILVYVMAVLAVLGTLKLVRSLRIAGDQALAVFLSIGAVTASIAISMGARLNLNAILFGSVLVVQLEDLVAGSAISLFTIAFAASRFGKMILYTVNEELARVMGVRVQFYEAMLAVMAGLAIVSGVKIAGVLLVTALLVLPTASTSLLATSMKKAILLSILLGEAALFTGVLSSFYLNIAPGASSVSILLVFFGFSLILSRLGLKV